ncbi:MAG: Amidohydrolase [Candidatus Tokpelaia hoelldobleri]|uniref:Amidohydrolase n=1 Tax=Candidatus Tokpelaia hoelldobleri TaxID=1902579 RepID=A0A1U9JV18_9HYPH|nr:MAG: Amidohydrolase [Candidatus Tokpelaia hoelldoblerii]
MVRIEQHIGQYIDEMITIRRQLHANPELSFKEKATSQLVASFLRRYGWEVTTGLAGTGVVGTLRNGEGRSIGIRADMDALPITEERDLPYKSKNEGVMHACGHDGHTTTLLTAARYLAETKNFSGTVHLIFQPAEENGGGANHMIQEGLFEKFPCDEIYGLHNWPGFAEGNVYYYAGAMMASCDNVAIKVKGVGGHGGWPHLAKDPVVAAAAMVTAFQSIVARNVSPLENAVITVGVLKAGTASNIIPETVEMQLSVRSMSAGVRTLLEKRITAVVKEQAAAFDVDYEIDYSKEYPVLINSEQETGFIRDIATAVLGAEQVHQGAQRMSSEDFACYLEHVPGCYIGLGNGDSAMLHNPKYDFNDNIILTGAILWGAVVEQRLAKKQAF